MYRRLGKLGPRVSRVGYGCMGLTESYGKVLARADSIKLIRTAFHQHNVNFFDTADMYGGGQNEEILGESLRDISRDKVVIATKCGIVVGNNGMKINNTPQYIKQACTASLRRLGISHIDVYYLHRHNRETPIEESMLAMHDLIKDGVIHHVGLSEVDAETIGRAHKILGDRLVAVQTEYSIMNRVPAEMVLPTCRKLNIAFVPYSPVGRGFLSGKITDPRLFKTSKESDFRSILPQFQPDVLPTNLRLVTAIENIAKKKGCTPAQLSLAWLLAQGEDIIPIPGTRNIDRVKENVASASILLSKEDLAGMETVYRDNPVKGNRLPDELLRVFDLKM